MLCDLTLVQEDSQCILVISMASRSVEYDKIYLYITYMSETQYKHSVVENDIRRSSQANPV